jgi:hypothetical protein
VSPAFQLLLTDVGAKKTANPRDWRLRARFSQIAKTVLQIAHMWRLPHIAALARSSGPRTPEVPGRRYWISRPNKAAPFVAAPRPCEPAISRFLHGPPTGPIRWMPLQQRAFTVAKPIRPVTNISDAAYSYAAAPPRPAPAFPRRTSIGSALRVGLRFFDRLGRTCWVCPASRNTIGANRLREPRFPRYLATTAAHRAAALHVRSSLRLPGDPVSALRDSKASGLPDRTLHRATDYQAAPGNGSIHIRTAPSRGAVTPLSYAVTPDFSRCRPSQASPLGPARFRAPCQPWCAAQVRPSRHLPWAVLASVARLPLSLTSRVSRFELAPILGWPVSVSPNRRGSPADELGLSRTGKFSRSARRSVASLIRSTTLHRTVSRLATARYGASAPVHRVVGLAGRIDTSKMCGFGFGKPVTAQC